MELDKKWFSQNHENSVKKVTIAQKIEVSSSKLDKSSDHMTDKQFDAMHEMTWNLCENPNIPFGKRLEHKQSHCIQGLRMFEYLRERYMDTYKKYLLSTRTIKLAAHLQERIFL